MRKNQKRKKSENAESIDEANTTAAAAAAALLVAVAVAVISRSLPSRRGCSAALALRAKKRYDPNPKRKRENTT